MEFPRLVYKSASQHVAVEDEADMQAALAAGWFATVPEALAGKAADNAPPTREELRAKATELGLSFGPNTSDKKLGDMIAAKLAG